MRRKLQHLTIVTMAVQTKRLAYDELLQELGIANVRDLEDLIIDAIYANVIHGKLDQQKRQLEVDYTIGRDVRMEDIGQMTETLKQWSAACETVLQSIETQIERANEKKASILSGRTDIDAEIRQIRDSLRTQQNDGDEAMASSDPAVASVLDMRKRFMKGKSTAAGSGPSTSAASAASASASASGSAATASGSKSTGKVGTN